MSDELKEENERLRNALRHVWHYFASPNSYSEEERRFVIEIVETEGKVLEGKDTDDFD
jgi:hypothetical protein